MKAGYRVVAGGVVWAVIYNFAWGVAWFAFMRSEWLDATVSRNRPMPLAEIWAVWVALTFPLGVATMAYVADRARSGSVSRATLAGGLALWVPMTLGMAALGWHESLPMRVLLLDSIVNLAAIGAASLAGEWSQHAKL